MIITFEPRDIIMLGLMLLVACVAGLLIGYVLRRVLRPAAPFDSGRALALFAGFWSFGMLFSLVSDLVTKAGQPFWLKIVLLLLLLLFVMSFGVAQYRALLGRHGGPTEPVRTPATKA